MICEKTIKIAMGVSMVLCASASFAGVQESFEGSTLDSEVWFCDGGVVTNESYSYTKNVGHPLDNDHTNILNIAGTVICSNTTDTATSSTSDFLVNISECSDELGTDEVAGAKIALAAGTALVGDQVPLCIYCTTNNNGVGWNEIARVDTGAWVRVTLAFTNGFCRVSLDGEPVKKPFGYTTSDGSTSNGAWYKLAGNDNSVESLEFIGCAKLDDVVIKDSFTEITFPEAAVAALNEGLSVGYNALNEWGMTTDNLNTLLEDTSTKVAGLTYAQRIECGLNPTSNTKFEPLSITPAGENAATITFPCEDASKKTHYSLGAVGGSAVFTGGASSITVDGGVATAGITLSPDDGSKVVKFWLKAEK